jgi:shikimate dehydrogenase
MPLRNLSGRPSPLFGLLGYPLAHTQSPALHGQALTRLALHSPDLCRVLQAAGGPQGAYALYPVYPAQHPWDQWLQQRFDQGLVGLNVTLPYKVDLMQHVASCDATAHCCGATNTLVRTASGYRAYNTDVAGLLHVLRARWPGGGPQSVLVLGAGGAARAAVVAAWQLGATRVAVSCRQQTKAQAMAHSLLAQARLHGIPCSPIEVLPWLADPAAWHDLDTPPQLVVQATSLGLHPADPLLPPVPPVPAVLPAGAFCLDLVYGSAQAAGHTPWTVALQQQGIACQAGFGVLRAQAAVAMHHWLQVLPVAAIGWEAVASAYALE